MQDPYLPAFHPFRPVLILPRTARTAILVLCGCAGHTSAPASCGMPRKTIRRPLTGSLAVARRRPSILPAGLDESVRLPEPALKPVLLFGGFYVSLCRLDAPLRGPIPTRRYSPTKFQSVRPAKSSAQGAHPDAALFRRLGAAPGWPDRKPPSAVKAAPCRSCILVPARWPPARLCPAGSSLREGAPRPRAAPVGHAPEDAGCRSVFRPAYGHAGTDAGRASKRGERLPVFRV